VVLEEILELGVGEGRDPAEERVGHGFHGIWPEAIPGSIFRCFPCRRSWKARLRPGRVPVLRRRGGRTRHRSGPGEI